ncbi:MAG: family 43 glycosylhydrolase [Clostridia bacterium]|nr:family 43 glycosylhydrolase [Clostridia bacterium]
MKKVLAVIMAAAVMLVGSVTALANNPIVKTDGDGNRVYGGDPAILVDGDTVYLFIGHDTATGSSYNMPDWLCYSSTDLLEWTYEGVPLSAGDFSWGSSTQAWASQVVKYNDKYYFYMCKSATGMSVGVSDSPTGPYTDALNGKKLVDPSWTNGAVSWDDIDPTVWIEEDEDGVEHRYLCWGNSNCYMAELDETMISLEDANGDGTIDGGDITEIEINGIPEDSQYTEAPWLYKRGDTYYLFFASNWQEELSYATSDNIWGPYEYGGVIMPPGSSSNTNHPAVFDFKGKTYIVYHTGALENGSGYRRSVCIDELIINEDGTIDMFEESSVGLDGEAVYISPLSDTSEKLYHAHFENLPEETMYPTAAVVYSDKMTVNESDFLWEIVPGRGNEDYVSIQSVNKMGYFITNENSYIKLLHDNDGLTETAESMTFIEHEGLAGVGVSYESMTEPGQYLTVVDGMLCLTNGSDKDAATFIVKSADNPDEIDIECDENGITLSGTYAGERDAVLIYIKDESGSVVDMELLMLYDEHEINYTYVPEKSGRYTVYFGTYEKTIDYEGGE